MDHFTSHALLCFTMATKDGKVFSSGVGDAMRNWLWRKERRYKCLGCLHSSYFLSLIK